VAKPKMDVEARRIIKWKHMQKARKEGEGNPSVSRDSSARSDALLGQHRNKFPLPPHRGYPAMLGSKVAGAARGKKEAEGMEFGFSETCRKREFCLIRSGQ
jgi:hypothetical protein